MALGPRKPYRDLHNGRGMFIVGCQKHVANQVRRAGLSVAYDPPEVCRCQAVVYKEGFDTQIICRGGRTTYAIV